MIICVRCLVSGRVQGVFYRASARQQAQILGISGSARNRSDGRVEVVACGESRVVEQFKAWLAKGPPHAQVTSVSCEPLEAMELQGFTTG